MGVGARAGATSRLLTGLLLAGALLGLAEAAARLYPPPDPLLPMAGPSDDADPGILLRGSPWLLWELQPGTHREKGHTVAVNRLGMRDADRGAKTRPRMLVVGDSSVYGFGVADTEHFPAVLEQGAPADFINAAVPGYSSLQALNLLQLRGLSLAPDVLLVGTLWSDNNFDSFHDEALLAAWSGWASSQERSPLGTARGWLQNSLLFRWLDWHLRVAPQGERAKKTGWIVGDEDARIGSRRVPIARYAAALDRMAALMQGRALFLILPNREDLAPPRPHAWNPYRETMRRVAARWGAPVIDGPAAFIASGRSPDALFLDAMHPTRAGHRLLAAAAASALHDKHWPDQPWPTATPSGDLTPPPDPFEGQGGETGGNTLRGTLQLPAWTGGPIRMEILPPAPGAAPFASTTLQRPGPWEIEVGPLPPTALFRLSLDPDQDGPDPDDPRFLIGPIGIPPDGRVELEVE